MFRKQQLNLYYGVYELPVGLHPWMDRCLLISKKNVGSYASTLHTGLDVASLNAGLDMGFLVGGLVAAGLDMGCFAVGLDAGLDVDCLVA